MFILLALFLTPLLLYIIYDLLGRKLTIEEFDKKAVLITGCGSGFGRGLVKRCLQNGLAVFAGCEFESDVKNLEENYNSISQNRLHAFQMNVTDDDSVRKAKEYVDKILRDKNLVLHALVNNAGVRGNLFHDDFLTLEDYKNVWEVNVLGVIRVTHAFKNHIKKSRGRIVICTSCITLCPLPTNGPYTTSKHAILAYSIVIRHELQPYGVDVIDVIPGSFRTGMQETERLQNMVDKVWYRASQKLRDEFGSDYNEKAKAFAKEMVLKTVAKDTTQVIDAYYEAIVAKRPKLLYRVGWDVVLVSHPYSFLPVRLQVFVMKFFKYLTGAPSPAIERKAAWSHKRVCKSL